MGNLVKMLTGILGILAVIACLTTIGIIGYTLSGGGGDNKQTMNAVTQTKDQPSPAQENVPVSTPENGDETEGEATKQPVNLEDHVHNYEETMDRKATCYQAGRLKYTCTECGDFYYVDVASTGHVRDEEWETVRKATKDEDGLRVKRCIYCDEIVAQETIPYTESKDPAATPHTHEYVANTEREPSCILAGLRKYTCNCGSFYTEQIPAPGHVATDWTVVEEPTATKLGRQQRTCTVCGVLLDSRPIPVKAASPSPSAAATATAASAATATVVPTTAATASPSAAATASAGTASASPTPTATPHSHEYVSYVLKDANCTEKGIRSFMCSCGSSYAESIELDLNRHEYVANIVPATSLSPGYTLYRCKRCNASYMDNYTQVLATP